MKLQLFPFQQAALSELESQCVRMAGMWDLNQTPHIISFTSPTGSGKTIIISTFIEDVFRGSDQILNADPDAIFVWLSDSPELNRQSRQKIDSKANRIAISQCIEIADESFDQKTLDPGHIYFLNTQKLSKSSLLTSHSEIRTYTIWETLANTVSEYGSHLYVIIDEAHRGAKTKPKATKGQDVATTTMAKFIKGSPQDGLPRMPRVIGMSATIERFNKLVEGLDQNGDSQIRSSVRIAVDDVRKSGLLKERVYCNPIEDGRDTDGMPLLRLAVQDWVKKCDAWEAYHISPILLVQVEDGEGEVISKTDLGECFATIQTELGTSFKEFEVVHSFGNQQDINIDGYMLHYVEPSSIDDDKRIRIVFFKESLTTGWDCPRAESMMSFRSAKDSTYIAQLLGRMIRTPLQQRMDCDDTLNDVSLFLPRFSEETLDAITKAISEEEGIAPEIKKGKTKQILGTAHPLLRHKSDLASCDTELDRGEIVAAINSQGIANCIRTANKKNTPYLTLLFKMAQLLVDYEIKDAKFVANERTRIVKIIHDYITQLQSDGQYEKRIANISHYSVIQQSYDAIEMQKTAEESTRIIVEVSDTDLEREFTKKRRKLGEQGVAISNEYARQYYFDDPVGNTRWKKDIILFVDDAQALFHLEKQARERYAEIAEQSRLDCAFNDAANSAYNTLIKGAAGEFARPTFRFPDTMDMAMGLYECTDHLFADNTTGLAKLKLEIGGWEERALSAVRNDSDYVCWVRNEGSDYILSIPYIDNDGNMKLVKPDILVIRKAKDRYVMDIVDPHFDYSDRIPRAKGIATWAAENPQIGRILLIREVSEFNSKLMGIDCARRDVQQRIGLVINDAQYNQLWSDFGTIIFS